MVKPFDYWAKVNDWIVHCHRRYATDDLDTFFARMEENTISDSMDRFGKLIDQANLSDVYTTSCVFANRSSTLDYLQLRCLLHYCDYSFRSIRIARFPEHTSSSPALGYLNKYAFNDWTLDFCDAVIADCLVVEAEMEPLVKRASEHFPEEPDGFSKDLLRFINGVYQQYKTGEAADIDMGLYTPPYAQWKTSDPESFAQSVLKLFAIHQERSQDTRFSKDEDSVYYEFSNHFYAAFPAEILMVYKLRERLGIPSGPSFESLTGLSIPYPFQRHEDTGDPNVPRIRRLIKILEEKAPHIPELYGKD